MLVYVCVNGHEVVGVVGSGVQMQHICFDSVMAGSCKENTTQMGIHSPFDHVFETNCLVYTRAIRRSHVHCRHAPVVYFPNRRRRILLSRAHRARQDAFGNGVVVITVGSEIDAVFARRRTMTPRFAADVAAPSTLWIATRALFVFICVWVTLSKIGSGCWVLGTTPSIVPPSLRLIGILLIGLL